MTAQAMPELRFRVSRHVHGEVTRLSGEAGMRLSDYARALVSGGVLEPEERVRQVECMRAEIERLTVLTAHLRTELDAAKRVKP